MDKFHTIQVFIEVAEKGGFASAARDLNMSPPAVTRAVALLEENLRTRLFVRTTRSVRLTESGERFLVDAKRILQELAEAENAAIGAHTEPRGELRLTAPVLFGRLYVTPVLQAYLNQYDQVSASTLFVDRIVNMLDEGLDVAIRIGELPDSSLSAVRVGQVGRTLFASPEYLSKHPKINHPNDLLKHQIVQSLAMNTSREWGFQEQGKEISMKLKPRLQMNTNDAVIEAVLNGGGISRLLSYQLADDIKSGKLTHLLPSFELPPLPVHVMHGEGRMVSAKVRSFVDFMVDRLRADPALNFSI